MAADKGVTFRHEYNCLPSVLCVIAELITRELLSLESTVDAMLLVFIAAARLRRRDGNGGTATKFSGCLPGRQMLSLTNACA